VKNGDVLRLPSSKENWVKMGSPDCVIDSWASGYLRAKVCVMGSSVILDCASRLPVGASQIVRAPSCVAVVKIGAVSAQVRDWTRAVCWNLCVEGRLLSVSTIRTSNRLVFHTAIQSRDWDSERFVPVNAVWF